MTMTIPKPGSSCRYRYDPLDRLASCLPLGQADTHSFYRLNKLTTEIQGQIRTSRLHADDRLLAQYQQDAGKNERVLIATDAPGSVIHALGADQPQAFGYTPYGTRAPTQATLHLPGFNGERRDPVTGHYLLGNGYRAFNPVLMRFNSPDSLSPFGEGGLNAYAYCVGDPVNRVDSTGRLPKFVNFLFDWMKGQKTGGAIPATRMTIIEKGIFSFEKINVPDTLYILGHGSETSIGGFNPIVSEGTGLPPQALYNRIINAGINPEKYEKLHLIMCQSANGGADSYAAHISKLFKKQVTGYENNVFTTMDAAGLVRLIKRRSPKIHKLPDNTYEYKKGIKIHTKNPFTTRSKTATFNYKPVTFRSY